MTLVVGAFALVFALSVIVAAEVVHRRAEAAESAFVDDEPGWADDAFVARREDSGESS